MLNIFKAGKQHDVHLMIGIGEKDIRSIYQNTVEIVPNTKQGKSKMYVYMFAHLPSNWKADGAIAWHSLENGYVFGQPQLMAPGNFDNYGVPNCAKTVDPGWDWKDEWMTEFMVKTWIQFAATGDPNLPKHAMGKHESLPIWPPYVYGGYSRSSDKYYYIVVPPEVRTGFSTLVYPSAPCP